MKLNPFAMMREEFDGTGIVFDPDRNKAISLNRTGVIVWNVLAKGGTGADAVRALRFARPQTHARFAPNNDENAQRNALCRISAGTRTLS